MTLSNPDLFNLERQIARTIQDFYDRLLGVSQSQVSCHLSNQILTIVIENSISIPEKLTLTSRESNAVLRWRSQLETAIQSQIRSAIEAKLKVPVLDVLIDTNLQAQRTGLILILESIPTALTNPT
ncbi:MAG: DUF2294 family protein [Cyanobacteria bacterium J055]|nr:MAG: DUF2294 family protein [Cyanobacteria bacterium J055]